MFATAFRRVPRRITYAVLLALLMTLLVPIVVEPRVIHAQSTHTVTVTPNQGPVGTPVTVHGEGFAPGATALVRLVFQGRILLDVTGPTIPADGTFSVDITIPTDAGLVPGDVVNVSAADTSSSGSITITTFTVTQASTPTTTVPTRIWAGYAVAGAPTGYSDVKASWQVPRVQCGPPNVVRQVSAFWIGLGGIETPGTTAPLEQIATVGECFFGEHYRAYTEMVQTGSEVATPIPHPVTAGDIIVAEVKYSGGGEYAFTMQDLAQDLTLKWVYSDTKSGSSDLAARSTAEWIVEAAAIGASDLRYLLANFGTVHFFNCAIDNAPISSGPQILKLELTQRSLFNFHKALPTDLLLGGTAFDVTWHRF